MIKTMIFTLSFLSKAKENFIWFTSTAWRGKSGRAAEGGAVEGQQNQLHNFLQGDKSNILTGPLLGLISFKCFQRSKLNLGKVQHMLMLTITENEQKIFLNRSLENQPK